MMVDGVIVCPVNILCLLTRFTYPGLTQNESPVVEMTNSSSTVVSSTPFPSYKTAGCYLTAVYNGTNITFTSPVLLFLCVERALLVLLPTTGKDLMKRFGLKGFVVFNIG